MLKKSVRQTCQWFRQSRQATNATAILASTIIVNALMLGYHVYLGRTVTTQEFGLIAFVGSLVNLAFIPISALSSTIAHQAAYCWGKFGHQPQLLWRRYRRVSLIASLILTGIWIGCIPFFQRFFNLQQTIPLLLLTPVWFFSLLSAVNAGYLIGIHQFSQTAISNSLETLTFVLVSIFFLQSRLFDLFFLAYPLSMFLTYHYETSVITNLNRLPTKRQRSLAPPAFPWKFFSVSLITLLSSLFFTNADVLLAKHYLSTTEAGEYALLSLVGKMLFYASCILSPLVIPMVSRKLGSGQDPRTTFRRLFAATGAIVLTGVVVVGLWGKWTLPLLLGAKAASITAYLPWYTVGMACFGLAHFLLSYYQAHHRFEFTFISLVSCIILLVGVGMHHGNPGEISRAVSLAGIASLVQVYLYRSYLSLAPTTHLGRLLKSFYKVSPA